MATVVPAQESSNPESHGGLREGALHMFDAIIMAFAGSAPAYSLAATTPLLIGAAGLYGPGALLWCAIPMLGIAIAFSYLGRLDVNAGASYSWVARALHPALGFISGWSLVVSATIFMVAGSLPAGQYTLSLFSDTAANNTWACIGVGAFVFLVMAALVLRGVTITARAQWVMTGVEVTILVIFGIAALIHGGDAASFQWSWLWGWGHFGGMSGFAGAALIAAFYFWGWDVTANLSEETAHSERNSGTGGLIGVIGVFVLFEMFTIAVNMMFTADQVAGSDNLLGDLGTLVAGNWAGKLLVFAVVLSTVATLETTLIQVTRTLFAMGRDRTLPRLFGAAHARWLTPWFAVVVVTVVSLLLFVGSTKLGGVSTIMGDAITAIGLQICIYYALAGISVVVAYRKVVLTSVKSAILVGIWPALGAVFMIFLLVQSCFGPNRLTGEELAIGFGAVALGLIPMLYYWAAGSRWFSDPGPRLDASAETVTEVGL
jgi:amino acid transporter